MAGSSKHLTLPLLEGGKVWCKKARGRPGYLTTNHKDEEKGGHPRRDVEHDADVMGQLVHVVHVGHQDGGDEEADGDAELEEEKKQTQHKLKNVVLGYKEVKKDLLSACLSHTKVTFFIYMNFFFSCF